MNGRRAWTRSGGRGRRGRAVVARDVQPLDDRAPRRRHRVTTGAAAPRRSRGTAGVAAAGRDGGAGIDGVTYAFPMSLTGPFVAFDLTF